MKVISKVLLVFVVMSAFAVAKSHAQIYVRVRPEPPREQVVVVRPERPSPRHVWIDAEWSPYHGTYIYHPAHWTIPPYPGAVFIPGRWVREPRGERYIAGHWAR